MSPNGRPVTLLPWPTSDNVQAEGQHTSPGPPSATWASTGRPQVGEHGHDRSKWALAEMPFLTNRTTVALAASYAITKTPHIPHINQAGMSGGPWEGSFMYVFVPPIRNCVTLRWETVCGYPSGVKLGSLSGLVTRLKLTHPRLFPVLFVDLNPVALAMRSESFRWLTSG